MNDERCWQAVLARDREADGTFVYGVRSTGIYCRPSCPSRRPHRSHVIFFSLAAAAEQAGFRACRRCLPDQVAAHEPPAWVEQARAYIESRLDRRLTLTALGAHVNVSPFHLQRTFKRVMGVTPRQFAEARRLERLKANLKDGNTVTAALYEAGYGSSSRLYEKSPGRLGMTPSAYRNGGHDMHIGYTIVDSPLGRLLVAATDRGICAVSLGDSDGALESALRSEYPAAEVHPAADSMRQWVIPILDYLNGRPLPASLPLDVRGTAFQARVWEALRSIPYGATRTYAEIARSLGSPGAVRAVGQACAANPAALVIPCHRAVRAGGGLGGYRWGIARKQALLARERMKAEG